MHKIRCLVRRFWKASADGRQGHLSYITKKSFFGVKAKDLEGIVSQLRVTAGVEVAIFLYELESGEFKVSLRSKEKVDVSKVARYFGGGGHVRAAGLTFRGTVMTRSTT